jgi:dihydroorotase
MSENFMRYDAVLKNGRVIDPTSGLDRVCDLAIQDGKIAAVGETINPADCSRIEDLSGLIVAPGLIDIHVHAYGPLGFLNPDTIGVFSGVTAMVDAGSAGPYNYPELEALLGEQCQTDWFSFLHLPPLGVTGANEKHHKYARSITTIPLAQMIDWAEQRGSHIRGLKIGAFGDIGLEPIQLAKAIARILKVPLYIHIGDFLNRPKQITTPKVLDLLDSGDMITHIYTSVYGGPFTESGLAVKELKAAQERGVVLDVGFGSFNFSYAMARAGFERGIFPDTISSDLQNINVMKPARSLCHVMSIFLNMGMGLIDVLERVTARAAKAIGEGGEPWRGRIVNGAVADLSILKIEEGDYSFSDTDREEMRGNRRIVPVKVWKAGVEIECNVELAQAKKNWLVEKNDGSVSETVDLDAKDRFFLAKLKEVVAKVSWTGEKIHETIYPLVEDSGLDLRRAVYLVQKLCLKRPFPQSMAILLYNLGRAKAVANIENLIGKN